jgi:hypothetical protein
MIAAAAAQAIHRNLIRSAISAPAPSSSSTGPSRTAAFALDLAAAPSPSSTRAIRRENSAVAAVGYLIRQQGQSCEGHSQ